MDDSLLKIGMVGDFLDGPAKITGRVTLQSEDDEFDVLDVTLWQLKSDNGETFVIREVFSQGETEDDDLTTYDILSDLDPNDTRSFEEAANEIFADWKAFDDVQIHKGLRTFSSDGKVGDLPTEDTVVKMADVIYENDENDYDLDDDEVLTNYCVFWNADSTWVFCMEPIEEDEILEYFNI